MDNKVEILKEKILEALKDADIAKMYVLQDEAVEIFDDEALNGFFANILDLALENLTNTLESCNTFDMSDVQDFATVRALYEYAMEHYHAGAIEDASALFEVLAGITKDEMFTSAMKNHLLASQNSVTLDTFINTYADLNATQKSKTFYISYFKEEVQELLNMKKTVTE